MYKWYHKIIGYSNIIITFYELVYAFFSHFMSQFFVFLHILCFLTIIERQANPSFRVSSPLHVLLFTLIYSSLASSLASCRPVFGSLTPSPGFTPLVHTHARRDRINVPYLFKLVDHPAPQCVRKNKYG